MYEKRHIDIKIIYFYFGVKQDHRQMTKPGSKKQSGKKIEILICGCMCCFTLHYSKKCMKKYACYNSGQVIF